VIQRAQQEIPDRGFGSQNGRSGSLTLGLAEVCVQPRFSLRLPRGSLAVNSQAAVPQGALQQGEDGLHLGAGAGLVEFGPKQSAQRVRVAGLGGHGHVLAVLELQRNALALEARWAKQEQPQARHRRGLPVLVLFTAVPLLRDRGLVEGQPTAYLCRACACRAPATPAEGLRAQLE
jgi:hypothetical protein